MRARHLLVGFAAAVALTVPAAPALAEVQAPIAVFAPTAGGGEERLCLVVEDPDAVGSGATTVCTPQAQWYADMIDLIFSMTP